MFCNRIWKGEEWPKVWKEGVVIPIRKKGKGKKTEDYKGITLMAVLYKIYLMVLTERIRIDCEKKKVIPQNQTGFRKEMGIMDNIYVVNYIINNQLGRGKKAVALFVDMKAAFDSVDRKALFKTMRERGIKESLIARVKEILNKTKSRVKIEGELGDCFWTARGVRQGCPLRPLVYSILIADLEKEMEKIKWSGIWIREKRIYSLAYADDIVLLAEDEDKMKSMIGRMEDYMDKKKLEVNVKKAEIMRFKKGGGRIKKKD